MWNNITEIKIAGEKWKKTGLVKSIRYMPQQRLGINNEELIVMSAPVQQTLTDECEVDSTRRGTARMFLFSFHAAKCQISITAISMKYPIK